MRASALALLSLAIFFGSFALSFGLTYLPCYSAICVEEHFPYNVRIHLASFYATVAAHFVVYFIRVKISLVRDALGTYVSSRPIPFTSTYLSWGGLLVGLGVVGFVGASQAYFWEDELEFYRSRALEQAGTTLGTTRLALVGSTGHLCDLLLGLMVLPVSRGGVLQTVFEFDPGTLLRFHKLVGYFFFLAICIHFIPFYSWVPVFALAEPPLKLVFGIDNPTMSLAETEENLYYATVLASGVIASIIFIAIIITSLPKARRFSYNTFYYTHMLSIIFFILVSIHASTDFYMLLPGLLLWTVDWILRLRGLGVLVNARLQKESSNWYRLAVSTDYLPSNVQERLRDQAPWPLKHFYLNVPEISKWQNHPFTTASAMLNTGGRPHEIVWLFRVSNLGKKEKKQVKEWTVKLAALLDSSGGVSDNTQIDEAVINDRISRFSGNASREVTCTLPTRAIELRLEGPYAAHHNPFSHFSSVLCIVGGTGITGALSLARTFVALKSSPESESPQRPPRCVTQRLAIVWSIPASEDAGLFDIKTLLSEARSRSIEISFRKHLTGQGRSRLDMEDAIVNWSAADVEGTAEKKAAEEGDLERGRSGGRSTWIYFSGPSSFMAAGEKACHSIIKDERDSGLDWHCAKWDT